MPTISLSNARVSLTWKRPPSRCARPVKGFSLIELLTVIAIIGILTAILIPALQAAREAARKSTCSMRLRQVALAVHSHASATNRLPPGHFMGPYGVGKDSLSWSWIAHVLPHLEEQSLYDRGRVGSQTLANSGIANARLPVLICPSDSYPSTPRIDAGDLLEFPVGVTNFKAVCGANWGHDKSQNLTSIGTDWPHRGANGSWDGLNQGDGAMFRSDYQVRRRLETITDGLSKTFLIGEVLPSKDRWTSWPYSNNAYSTCAIPPNFTSTSGNYDPLWWPNVLSFRSAHHGVVGFAMADGSVQAVSDKIDLDVYRGLATISGGEDVSVSDD